ncbi:MAG TPA: MFS transporter [Streptosporangiaceae bacterium]
MVDRPADSAVAAVDGASANAQPAGHAKETFGDVFAVREFRVLWLAQLLSVAGDQLARVAMTVLVYDRTHSALWSALTFAVTFLPWIVGGLGLSGLADRVPRRQVMIICDLARMVLVCLMALTSMLGLASTGLWVMVALLFLVTLLDSPFKSARSALVPDILTGEKYVLGTAVTQITFQVGLVSGFALGGLVVASLGVRAALLADAATFAVSALLLGFGVHRRPAAIDAAGAAVSDRSQFGEMLTGARLVFGDATLRRLMLFGWLVAFYMVPMGLAAPYAARFHWLPLAVGTGLVFAAIPLGTVVGALLFTRWVATARRQRLMGPLAVSSCGLLVFCMAQPGLIASLTIFALSGTCAAYQIAANAAFVAAVPAERRGQAFGLANGGMQVSQGLWFIAAGAAAEAVSPAVVIAISGGLGAAMAAALAISWRRLSASQLARS